MPHSGRQPDLGWLRIFNERLLKTLRSGYLHTYKFVQRLERSQFPDLVVATAIIDSTSAAISMALSGKQALTSRTFVFISSGVNLLVLAHVGVAALRASGLDLPNTSCQPRVYWWGALGAGQKVPASFWLYLSLRLVSHAHGAWLAIHFTDLFDLIEKADRGQCWGKRILPDEYDLPFFNTQALHGNEKRCTMNATEVRNISKSSYRTVTASASSLYWEYLLIIIPCTTAVENFLRRMDLMHVVRYKNGDKARPLSLVLQQTSMCFIRT